MGLLDGILGRLSMNQQQTGQQAMLATLNNMFGDNEQQSVNMLTMTISLVQQMGGISNVLNMLRRQGLGRQADSWVSTGPNEAISGQDVEKVFGTAQVDGIAAKLGIKSKQASSGVAQLLPELIDRFTPEGRVPENQYGVLSQAMSELRHAQK